MAALERGTPYREIAAEHHISIASLSKIARNMATLESGAVAKLMQSKALQALEAWELAMVKGAESGKHAPARDWLIHAKALDPIQSDASTGAKVAIIIGQVGQPVSVDVSQVIDTEVVSSESDTSA